MKPAEIEAKDIAMTKLGPVSIQTKGPVMTGWAETPDRMTPGSIYPIH